MPGTSRRKGGGLESLAPPFRNTALGSFAEFFGARGRVAFKPRGGVFKLADDNRITPSEDKRRSQMQAPPSGLRPEANGLLRRCRGWADRPESLPSKNLLGSPCRAIPSWQQADRRAFERDELSHDSRLDRPHRRGEPVGKIYPNRSLDGGLSTAQGDPRPSFTTAARSSRSARRSHAHLASNLRSGRVRLLTHPLWRR